MTTLRKTLFSIVLTGGVSTGLVGTALYTGLLGTPNRAAADDADHREEHHDDHHDDHRAEEDADHRALHQALDLLTQAKTLIDGTHSDFDGHREPTGKAIERAIGEAQAALGYQHYEDTHPHAH